MTSLSEIAIGRRAVDFIRSRLECGHYLASAMLPLLAHFADTASTFLPAVLPAVEIENFRTGGKVPQVAPTLTASGSRIAPLADAYAALTDLIEKCLSESSRHVVVIENANAQRGYPYLASRKSRLNSMQSRNTHSSSSLARMTARASCSCANNNRTPSKRVGAFVL